MLDKFIYCTDLHYGAKPIARKDDYNQAVLKEFEFILKLARKNKCVVLFGGDLTDSPKIKFFELMELMKLMANYKDVQIYGIYGNPGHDGLIESSPMTFLKMSGFLKGDEIFHDFESTRVIFCGHGKDVKSMDKYIHNEKYNILMTHQTLVEIPVIFEHTLINEFNTAANMVTIGHYHAHQGLMQREDGKVFVAPGAICRKKRTKEDMERIPRCVYMAIDGKELKSLKEIEIPTESDVWVNKKMIDIDDDVLYTDINTKVNDMKEILTTASVFQSLEDGISFFGMELKTDPLIINYAKERLKGV